MADVICLSSNLLGYSSSSPTLFTSSGNSSQPAILAPATKRVVSFSQSLCSSVAAAAAADFVSPITTFRGRKQLTSFKVRD